MQESFFDDPDHINFKRPNLLKLLHDRFETYKQRVRDKNKYYFFTSSKFFHCEIVFVLKEF